MSKFLKRLESKDISLRGRVNVRFNAKRRTFRLRFTSVHEDQAETIFEALRLCRKEAGTKYDAVALEFICMNYLATYSPPLRSARTECRAIPATGAVDTAGPTDTELS